MAAVGAYTEMLQVDEDTAGFPALLGVAKGNGGNLIST